MPKQTKPRQLYTIHEYRPPQPTMWQRHRTKVVIAGAVVGLIFVLPHVNDTSSDHAQLGPGTSTSADVRSCTQTP
ncbi:hypothetical protein FE633_13205 [Streptomyces montanus]|uniref:Uncharacterized protein n=1 Tax=Streptomyces montanus TaxID=2580423 RepID=A0A5R9FV04_9ACTN|nr:hypothetical protein [Streptomyces montanus]TLS45720.1 hypothetical protein FE633_13205 [Streptomyces montanus]